MCDTQRPVTRRSVVKVVGFGTWMRTWFSHRRLRFTSISVGLLSRLLPLGRVPGPFRLLGALRPSVWNAGGSDPPPPSTSVTVPTPGPGWGTTGKKIKQPEFTPSPSGDHRALTGRIFSLRILASMGPCVPLLIASELRESGKLKKGGGQDFCTLSGCSAACPSHSSGWNSSLLE